MIENIQTCNIKTCKNYVENTYKKCIQHRLLNRKSQQKVRGGHNTSQENEFIAGNIAPRAIKKKIYDKINKYYSTDLKKGLSLEKYITVDYIYELIEKTKNCIYCNSKILLNYQRNSKKQFSVDRIDSTLCHSIGNVQIICLSCNCSKGKKSHEEFIQYIENKNSCI